MRRRYWKSKRKEKVPKGCKSVITWRRYGNGPEQASQTKPDQINYMQIGNPSESENPTVLINCGWCVFPESYLSIARILHDKGYPTIIMPLRGVVENYPLGESTPKTYISDCAKDSLYVLKMNNVKRVILAPHSAGTLVALILSRMLKENGIELRKIVMNAPSVPEPISAFPTNPSRFRISSKIAAWFLRRMEARNGSISTFNAMMAKIGAYTFRVAAPLFIRDLEKASREASARYFRNLCTIPGETISLSATSLRENVKAINNILSNLQAQISVIGYSHDILVGMERVMKYIKSKAPGVEMDAVKIRGSHFEYEVKPEEIVREIV